MGVEGARHRAGGKRAAWREGPDMNMLTLKSIVQSVQNCSQSRWPLLSPTSSEQNRKAVESSTTFSALITMAPLRKVSRLLCLDLIA